MSNLKKEAKLEVREVVFCNEEENSFCDIFVYEPENVDERGLGNLYIVGEIVNLSDSSSYLVNLLASIIKKEFYSKTKRSTMESLEAGLHKANSTLSDLAEQGSVDWIGNLNMICGAYKENELYFSQVGNVKTLLVRDNQITDIGKNIAKEEKPHPFKTFTNIASGEIEKNDLILLATPEFFNIFSLEKIRQLSSSLDTDELTETIQDAIEQEENVTTVGLLVMKIGNEKLAVEKEEEFKEEEFEVEKDSESSKDLESEKIIEKNLPEEKPAAIDSKEKITLDEIIDKYEKAEEEKQTVEQKFEQKLKSTTEERAEEAVKEFEEIEKEKSITNKLSGLLKILRGLLGSAKNSVVTRFKNYKQKRKNISESDNSVEQKTENELLQKINLPSSKNKLILTAFIFIILLFAGNLIFTDYQKKAEEKFNFYNDILSQAKEKTNKAEEVAIYNDLAQARIFLTDAKNLTLEIKNNYNKLDKEVENLLDKINVQLDIVNIVNRINNPEIAVNLGQTAEQIMLINDEYYTFTSENAIYQINLADKKVDNLQVDLDEIKNSRLAIPIEKTEEIIFLSNDNKLSALDLNKKELASADIEFISDDPKIKDIASYNNYLYFLEPEANQIYKYRRTANGLDGGKSWITDSETDLYNAISLAIDGFIYVLKSDSTVDKYLSGVKKDFAVENLSEPVSSSAKIYTNADLEYLYIIDPPNQRIVLFNKINGSLIGQYTSDSFTDLKNIVIGEMEDKMYVLNGDKVFVIEIEGEE